VGEEGDADQAHSDRREIPQKRAQVDARLRRSVGERGMDQAERERRADQRARGRRQNCCAEAIPRRRGDREDPEAQQERHDVQRGERVKALRALEYAHRNRGYERCDEACLGENDHASRVDVEQIRERQGQHERKHDEGHGADECES